MWEEVKVSVFLYTLNLSKKYSPNYKVDLIYYGLQWVELVKSNFLLQPKKLSFNLLNHPDTKASHFKLE